MIIDGKEDRIRMMAYRIVYEDTGEKTHYSNVFYADDEAQVLRHYIKDAKGAFRLIPGTKDVAWEEVRPCRRFRIRLKDRWQSEEQAVAWQTKQEELFRKGQDNEL